MAEPLTPDTPLMSGKQKPSRDLAELLPFIFLIFGLVVLLMPFSKKPIKSSESVESTDQASTRRLNEERVNRYLKDAYNKKQLEEVRAKNEIARTNPGADVPRQGPVEKTPQLEYSGGDIEPEDRWSQASPEMGTMTPEETIQYQLKLKQDEAVRFRLEQQAFIEQFIENARRNGLEVQIDENLKVKSVKKIKQK